MSANDQQIIARLDALGRMIDEKEYGKTVDSILAANYHTGWTKPSDRLPDEGREVFFMTTSGPWAGQRHGDMMLDWGDRGEICEVKDVLIWQYAPQIAHLLFDQAYREEPA